MFKKIYAVWFFFVFITCLGTSSYAAFLPEGNTVRGIDVSYFNGKIDFARVKESGISAVYIRAAAGDDFIDPQFEENYKNARANGLKIGFYHNITPTDSADALNQAKFFVSLLSGKTFEMRPAMDYETFGGLNTNEINTIASVYLNALWNETGCLPAIYSNANNALRLWDIALADYPLWVANYGVNEPPENGKWKTWAGFQYSDTGRIDGISGNVDLDKFSESIFIAEYEPQTMPEKDSGFVYTIKRGDTLSAIAQKYNTSVTELARINSIQNPNLIYAGERITIVKNSSYSVRTYTVKRGDTLWGISRAFNTTVARIAAINNIKNPNLIFPGEKLIV